MIRRLNNTKQKGTIEFLVYKGGDVFVGVCLTFDIVEEGNNPIELMKSIREAAELHLATVIKENLSDDLLNRYAPAEYWERYFETVRALSIPSLKSNNISSFVVSPYQQSVIAEMA